MNRLRSVAIQFTVLIAFQAALISNASAQAEPAIDPKADQSFRDMSDTLSNAQAFSFRAEVCRDLVLAYGHKVQLSMTREMMLLRPGCIRGSNEGDLDRIDYWLNDGKMSVLDRDHGIYAQLETPETIDETLDMLAFEYGLVVPLADFLVTNPYESAMANVDYASYAGLHRVRGVACHHLIFRQPGLDWQLWIDAGQRALPVRMVINFTDQPHSPQWMADFYDWNLNPNLPEDVFTFEVPEGMREVAFQEIINNAPEVETGQSETPR